MKLSPTLLFLLSLFLLSYTPNAHNITRILAKQPEFSTFNHYLTLTHLAPEINRHETITVLAIDNTGMSSLLSKHLSLFALKNILSLHILLDYFGAKKLHQITDGTALAATMYQATGSAPGSSGFVNITDLKGGKVGFGAEDNPGSFGSTFVKSIAEIPYNISVIQISKPLSSPEAEAPTPAPAQMNLTTLMSKKGCKVFADTLKASGALETFQSNSDGGLTVFCPVDQAMKSFMPKYKNLTAEGKTSLLLYHGVPMYESIAMLKSGNGLMNTLATDGAKKFDFTVQNEGEEVTLKTKVVTAKITGTLLDEQPLAIYTVDTVLQPTELFKAVATAPAPAPTKAKAKSAKAKSPKEVDSSPPAPAGPEGSPADVTATDDQSGTVRFSGGLGIPVMVCLGVWFLM
ncbi:fasciclin-like arabinogalactan protein 2 [Tasmannia lanceolata]|uniref:fasciclin-like arabinogalactan protein 2 n=1 Tax=Tasmannia lanceolata TaxID=3420 RepID=UPI0040634353